MNIPNTMARKAITRLTGTPSWTGIAPPAGIAAADMASAFRKAPFYVLAFASCPPKKRPVSEENIFEMPVWGGLT